jgi:MFS superfamily sulfate permease-like transporter
MEILNELNVYLLVTVIAVLVAIVASIVMLILKRKKKDDQLAEAVRVSQQLVDYNDMPVPTLLNKVDEFVYNTTPDEFEEKIESMSKAVSYRMEKLGSAYRVSNKNVRVQVVKIGDDINSMANFVRSELVDKKTGRKRLECRKPYYYELSYRLNNVAVSPLDFFIKNDPDRGETMHDEVERLVSKDLRSAGAKKALKKGAKNALKKVEDDRIHLVGLISIQSQLKADVEAWQEYYKKNSKTLDDTFGPGGFIYGGWPEDH